MPRLLSLANVARTLRASTASASLANTARLTQVPVSTFKEPVFYKYFNTLHITQQQQRRLCFLASSRPSTTTSSSLQSYASRAFAEARIRSTVPLRQQQVRAFSYNNRYISSGGHHVQKGRTLRFLWRTMAISAAVIALPAVLLFGAPVISLIFVPVVVGGIVGGVLLLTGGLLFIFLPIAVIGGATAFWVAFLPASMSVQQLNKIIKRSKNGSVSALDALGPDWEIQPAGPNEWFKWIFPAKAGDKDEVSIRVGVFDPNDYSNRKVKMFKWMDSFEQGDDHEGTKRGSLVTYNSNSNFEFRNDSNSFSVESLSVIRDNDHFVIHMKDDGAKLLRQKWGKKYLELAEIVDRAANEIEARSSDSKFGNQVVLVQRHKKNSFWSKFSIHGDLALRIPVDRQWVHDVTDE
ncbi:hypothetical protein FBU30_009374 [Linnemannia zychae]|nr:hypothetical protein FBU30_009374 [Linnemannia zychae]